MILRWLKAWRRRRLCRTFGHQWVEVERYTEDEPHEAIHQSTPPDRNPVSFRCVVADCTGKVRCVRCQHVTLMAYVIPLPDLGAK